jgi:hypothetical protein
VLVERREHALERLLPAREACVVVAEDEIRGEREVEVAVLPARLRREEDALADRSVAVVAEERHVIAVVGEDAHAPVVRLLADAHDAERKPVLCIQPARLDVAEAVVLVARRRVGARVARELSEDDAGEEIDLSDDLERVAHLEARREPEPVRADRVLLE